MAYQLPGQPTEHPSAGDEALGLQLRADAIENRPEDGTLRLRQSRFSAQAPDVAVCLPGVQLPGVDDLFPFGQ